MKRFNLSEWAITHRALVLFMILLLGAAGVYSYFNLGRAEDPSFTIKVMVVNVAWPGATATEMQTQVADKIEKKLQELPYLDRVESYSQPGVAFIRVHSPTRTPPRQGEGAVVPGPQEGRRHPRRPAGRDHRAELQRRVRRRLFGALHAHRRRAEPRRTQDPRRGHPPAAAAGPRRQQGRHHRRAAGEDLHRVQPRQARDARRHPAADLRQRRPAERRRLRRRGRHRGRPHQPAGDRRVRRRRRDRRRAGRRRTGGCSASATSRQCRRGYEDPPSFLVRERRQAGARPRRLDAGRRQHRHARREPEEGDASDHGRAAGRHRGHADRRPAAHRRRLGLGVPRRPSSRRSRSCWS